MTTDVGKIVTSGIGLAVAALITVGAAGAQGAADIARGKKLYTDQGCYGCHTMGKTGTPIAPDLAQIGAKRDRAYLATWLRDPSFQRPTAHMPRIQLGAGDAEALAAYLSTLR